MLTSLAARSGSSRPSTTARFAVARARATYDPSVPGEVRGDVGEVRADRLDVAADDRAGQRGVAVGQRVVQRRGQQRAQGGGRVGGAGLAEQVHRLGDQGDEVVRAVREARVVERAPVLLDPDDAAAEGGDQRAGERPGAVGRGHPEHAAGQPGDVDVGAGERHRRVHREDLGAHPGGRGEHREAVLAGGVHDLLARADRAGGGQHRDHVRQHVVGHGEQQQVAGARHGGRLVDPDAREQRLDAGA